MLTLRRRIAIAAVSASAAALLAVLLIVAPSLERQAQDQTRERLAAEARLLAHMVEEPLARGAGSDELDALVDRVAAEIGARLTLVALDGRVLADSSLSGAALGAVENHAGRPEIREALASGSGSSVRHSSTVRQDMLYVAVVVRAGSRPLGVARAALSLEGVAAQASDLRRAVALALALAFVITVVLARVLASPLAGPLKEIMGAARQFADGNLTARVPQLRSDELGELARILNLSADNLEERLAENARERGRTDAILSAMEDGVLAVDHRGVVLLANEALRRNLELESPVGRHYVEVLRQREVGDVLRDVLATGHRRVAELEVPRLRRMFALAAVPFPASEGVPQGAVVTFHDVTERRRLEHVRRDFVANASHELRTPLTSIRGFVEALEDGAMADGPTAGRFLGKIRTHADRMAALVEDLLELSRLESGESPPRWESVRPQELAEEVVAGFEETAGKKGTTLGHADAGAPLVVTDSERLRRILDNLVDNALKYTPDGGRVELRTKPDAGGGACLEVWDNGPGISAEHLPRLFERFYRVDKARSREKGGTGLGLAIVRHLAEGMGASVTVTSSVGRGTCFSVWLPGKPPVGKRMVLESPADDS
jgi:two-component system phosphate regulon sensor histidine kinase PhoR